MSASQHSAASRRLAALKGETSDLQGRIGNAQTQDEALKLALAAVQLCMDALKLATDRTERSDIASKCNDLLDQAEHIKAASQWPVSVPRLPASSTAPKSDGAEDLQELSCSPLLLPDLGHSPGSKTSGRDRAQPQHFAALTSTGSDQTAPSHSPSLLDIGPPAGSEAGRNGPQLTPRVELSGLTNDRTQLEPLHPLLPDPAPGRAPHSAVRASSVSSGRSARSQGNVNPALPSPAERIVESRYFKTPEPTRLLATSEKVLLFKASQLNGFTFPPWQKAPEDTEFELRHGEEPYVDLPELGLSEAQLRSLAGWQRAVDALPPPCRAPGSRESLGPVMSTAHPIDLVQDATTDCSVVASLCAIVARIKRGHRSMLAGIIWPFDTQTKTPKISPNGKYLLRLNFNGTWRRVVIDDRLPVSRSARMLHVVDRRNPTLLWPALLEKAYLKVRGGYDFPGSSSCGDLWAMTGWIPEQVFLRQDDLEPARLWKRLFNSFGFGDVLITVGTGSMNRRLERELGLEGKHNYAVLSLKEEADRKLLLLKNPWCEAQARATEQPQSGRSPNRKGNLSILSSETSRDLVPGTFWIDLDRLFQHFESIYLNWNPGLFTYREDIHFKWDLTHSEDDRRCFINHPQFAITLEGSANGGSPVWLLLSRHFSNADGGMVTQTETANKNAVEPDSRTGHAADLPKGFLGLYIHSESGERVFVNDHHVAHAPYVDSGQLLLRWDPSTGGKYTVCVDQMELRPSTYTFTLSAFSVCGIRLEPATHRYDFQQTIASTWTSSNAGGNANSAAYFANPQFSLALSARGSIAILLQTPAKAVQVNVKLVHGRGERVYQVKSRDIIADSGTYSPGCCFARLDNVEPGTYTIICSTFEAGQLARFTLRLDSTVRYQLKAIPQEGAGMFSTILAEACFNPTRHKIAAPIRPRRLVKVLVISRFLRALSLPSSDLATYGEREGRLQSPLRVTIERGRGPAREILIASSDGEYSDDASGIRTKAIDLSPAMLLTADMWLVLDRLSPPSTGCEEWHQVEVLTDVAESLHIGVWRSWED